MQFVKKMDRKLLRFLAVILLLSLICLAPLVSQLYYYSRSTVTVEAEDVQYASVKDTVVSQEILLQGRASNLKVFFYAPSGQLYQDAVVRISVRQDGRIIETQVPATALLVGGAYETPPEVRVTPISKRESMYQVRADLSSLEPGWATVEITAEGLPDGTDLFCCVSRTLVSGLPGAKAGENELGAPLVLEYDVLKFDAAFWYETGLLAALFAVIVFTAYLLTQRRQWLEHRNWLFVCVFVMIFLFVSIRQPTSSFWGEPRSEAAYEFWYKAHEYGFFKSLMTLMSGEALAWMERILMWIADTLVPVRYVFVAAQLMELTFISFVTAMPCLNAYRRYFSDEVRMVFSLFLGTSLLFVKAYYFWSVSYWSLLFFIAFALLDLDRLRRWQYAAGLVLAAVLCVSRIFHAVLIPAALLLWVVLGKKRGFRFRLYCAVLALASAFEVVYSLLAGQHLSGNASLLAGIRNLGIWRVVENTFYFEVQVLNSFFTGGEHFQGGVANALFLVMLLSLIAVALWNLIRRDGCKELACFLLCIGIVSLGTVAITVITSGSYDWVSMPYNYSTRVSWSENYYQEGDLHFSYAYISLAYLLMAGAYVLKRHLMADSAASGTEKAALGRILPAAVAGLLAVLCIVNTPAREDRTMLQTSIPTQWKAVSYVTERDSYFIAVNTRYAAAPISLEHNSDELIYGVDEDGNGMLWDATKPAYEEEVPYHIAELGAVSDSEDKQILSVTAKRALTNFDVVYVAVFYDRDGNELARVRQANSPDRFWLDFIPEEPLTGVYSVAFELEDGSVAYIEDGLQVGYILEDTE